MSRGEPIYIEPKPYKIITLYQGSIEAMTLWAASQESAVQSALFNRCQRLELKMQDWNDVSVVHCEVDYNYPTTGYGVSTRIDAENYKNYEGPHPLYTFKQKLLSIQHRIEAENRGHLTGSPLAIIASELNDLIAAIPEPWKLTDR